MDKKVDRHIGRLEDFSGSKSELDLKVDRLTFKNQCIGRKQLQETMSFQQ